jgi:hypothetical protein
MVRSLWVRTLGALLVSTGLVWGQQPTSAPGTPPGQGGEIITIQEAGKPAQRCQILRTWQTAEGPRAHEVKPLDGGQMMTIVEGATVPGLSGDHAEARSTRIYHWSADGGRPAGTPVPPVQQVQYTVPAQGSQSPSRYVPVPAGAPAAPTAGSWVVPSAGQTGAPVVVSEVPEQRPGLGSRVKDMASHLFHRDRAEEMPTVIEVSPPGGVPVNSATAPLPRVITTSTPSVITESTDVPPAHQGLGSRVKEMGSRLFHRDDGSVQPGGVEVITPATSPGTVTAPGTGPTSMKNPYQTVPTIVTGTGAPARTGSSEPGGVVQASATTAAPGTWPSAFAQAPGAPTPENAPGTPGAAEAATRLTPTAAPAPRTQCQATSPGTAPCPCPTCQPTPLVTVQGSHQVPAGSTPSCSCSECQPVIVDGSAPRPSLRQRLAGIFSKEPAGETVISGPVVVSETPMPGCASCTPVIVDGSAKAAAEPAKPGDWRQSWGKLDSSKLEMTAAAKKTPDSPKGDVDAAKAEGASGPSKPSLSAPPPPLPGAATKGPDPLKDPQPYARVGSADRAATPAGEKDRVVPASTLFGLDMPKSVADAGKAVPAAAKGNTAPGLPSFADPAVGDHLPPGSRSVVDSGTAQYVPVPIVTVPDYRRPPQPPPAQVPQPPEPNYVDMSNAFTTPTAAPPAAPMVAQPSNAFSAPPPPPQASPAVAGAFGMPPGGYPMPGMYPPPGYGGPRAPGMMPPGYPGMMPSGYGPQMPRGPYSPMPYGPPAVPAMYQPNPAGSAQVVQQTGYSQPAAGPQVAMANPPANLLPDASALQPAEAMATLRDSIYPSQREFAASRLASLDWRGHGDVVQALVTAARQDPAPLVRAACVRALARMQCNTPQVLSTLQGLKTDGDPRVLHEVEQALATMGPSGK